MKKNILKIGFFVIIVLLQLSVHAQSASANTDGVAGIDQATTNIALYFGPAVKLMYAIGAILGIVGAIKVYIKWSRSDYDTIKVATAWFGACIFLIVVATILTAFFNVHQ